MRIAMIAITTSNSISVKPRRVRIGSSSTGFETETKRNEPETRTSLDRDVEVEDVLPGGDGKPHRGRVVACGLGKRGRNHLDRFRAQFARLVIDGHPGRLAV